MRQWSPSWSSGCPFRLGRTASCLTLHFGAGTSGADRRCVRVQLTRQIAVMMSFAIEAAFGELDIGASL